MYLDHIELFDVQIEQLDQKVTAALSGQQETVLRLAEVPGLGADSAQQIIAEVGPQAATFDSPQELASWVGVCPGQFESADKNQSGRCAKSNRYLRRLLSQAAQSAVRAKGTQFQALFRRLLPRLGYKKAIWAIAHRICRLIWKILHRVVRYIEYGEHGSPKDQRRRAQRMVRQPRKLGYQISEPPPPAEIPALA